MSRRLFSVVDVGTPPSSFERYDFAEVCYHGFEALSTEGEEVASPEFTCLGHRWRLRVYPGGHDGSDDGGVAVYLQNMSDETIEIEYFFSIRDATGKEVSSDESGSAVFAPRDSEAKNNSWGSRNFVKRSTLVKALENGTLTIEVRMREYNETNTWVTPYVPKNPLRKNILKKFMDEESADVVFEVGSGSEQGDNNCKRAKTTPTKFHAHQLVLQDGAPMLAELFKPGGEKSTTIPITDVKPDIFHHMLYYMYGGELTDEELETNAKDLIDAADKYGVVSLKLEAEECYVRSIKLTVENVIGNLIYADSKNCAYLKEAVMDFMVENGEDILDKVSFDDLPGSLMKDLLATVTRGKQKSDRISDAPNYKKMKIGELRRRLDDKGLDVDGSREAMIALLKESSKESSTGEDGENNEDDDVDEDGNDA